MKHRSCGSSRALKAGLAAAVLIALIPVPSTLRAQGTPTAQATPGASAVSKAENPPAPEPVSLGIGRLKTLEASGAKRLLVADPSILEARIRNDGNAVVLQGLLLGKTTVTVISESGAQKVYSVNVEPRDLEKELAELQSLITASGLIGLTAMRSGDNILVKGRIVTLAEKHKWESIIDRFDVIDVTESQIVASDFRRRLEELRAQLEPLSLTSLRVELLNPDSEQPTLYLKGTATTTEAIQQTERLALEYFPKVLNSIVHEPPMIAIDVVIATIERGQGRTRGVGDAERGGLWEQLGLTTSFQGGFEGGVNTPDTNTLQYLIRPDDLRAQLRLNKDDSQVADFIEQSQTVASGKTAEFRDAGKIFFEVSSSESTSLEAVDVGLVVTTTPRMLEGGKVRMEIKVSNSLPQPSGFGGKVETKEVSSSSEVELEPRKTIVVAGAEKKSTTTTTSEAPGLGKIPVLNLLFKNKQKSSNTKRSFIFLTPEFPTIQETRRAAFSESAPGYSDFIEDQAQLKKTGLGFWLGYEKDYAPEPVVNRRK